MAVKPEKIKERLKALFPKANLSQKRIDELSAKLATKPADDADDAAVDGFINDANDLMGFEGIAREDDRIRTLEANQKKPTDPPVPPVPPVDPPLPPADDQTPAWVKAILDSNNILKAEIEAIKTGKITETKKHTASQAVDASEVFKSLKPEQRSKWVDRINLESEISFEDQVKEFETEFTDIKQTLANSSTYAGPTPSATGTDGKPSDKELDSVISAL